MPTQIREYLPKFRSGLLPGGLDWSSASQFGGQSFSSLGARRALPCLIGSIIRCRHRRAPTERCVQTVLASANAIKETALGLATIPMRDVAGVASALTA